MDNLQQLKETLHARNVNFTLQDYMFCILCVTGEEPTIAYSIVFDQAEYKKVMDTDKEQDYLQNKKNDTDVLLQQQQIIQLKSELEESYRAEIQKKALSLEQVEFTASDVQALLNKLLASQAQDLDSASIREMLSIIHELMNNFGLSSGNDAFAKHFITVNPKFNALCHCGHEMDIVGGIDCICPHCHQVYQWNENEQRFFPKPTTL
jgi:hypothetical protein